MGFEHVFCKVSTNHSHMTSAVKYHAYNCCGKYGSSCNGANMASGNSRRGLSTCDRDVEHWGNNCACASNAGWHAAGPWHYGACAYYTPYGDQTQGYCGNTW